MTTAVLERRLSEDRRRTGSSFRYPERRTGFDRRAMASSWWMRMLDAYRRRPALIASSVGLIAVLSVADLLLTWRLLDLGATEVNPVMASLYDGGLAGAAILKGVVTAAVAAGIVVLRRYRRVLELSIVLVAGLAVLVGYELMAIVAVLG